MRGSLLLLPLVVSACAVGNEHSYHDAAIQLAISGGGKVAVATHDQRPAIVSGTKNQTFSGLQRGGYGNPFSVTTASGQPLAADMSRSIAAALQSKGFEAEVVDTSPVDSKAEVIENLRQGGAQRLVLLTLREWKSDTYKGTALIYDVVLEVMDPSRPLGQTQARGEDDLGGSWWNPPGHARSAVPKAFTSRLNALFASPDIERALQAAPTSSDP